MIAAVIWLVLAAPPPGMVAVPGGTLERGREKSERKDETPPNQVSVSAFYLDATLVTRADFARFVDETHYRTSAEKKGWGAGAHEGMGNWEWERIPHATWRHPFQDAPKRGEARRAPLVEGTAGPSADNSDNQEFLADDAPVVMVSWDDAVAYCAHAGKRLPTEAEWEWAMRAGSHGTRFPWGDQPERESGKLGLNFWQGSSHARNLRTDGYVYVSPVRAFPPNDWGIYDPVGNVWQWTFDWWADDTYARTARAGDVRDPKGPAHGDMRVARGGSWWCGACTCEGYGLFFRGKMTPGAAFNNIGFRCAADVSDPRTEPISPAPSSPPPRRAP